MVLLYILCIPQNHSHSWFISRLYGPFYSYLHFMFSQFGIFSIFLTKCSMSISYLHYSFCKLKCSSSLAFWMKNPFKNSIKMTQESIWMFCIFSMNFEVRLLHFTSSCRMKSCSLDILNKCRTKFISENLKEKIKNSENLVNYLLNTL